MMPFDSRTLPKISVITPSYNQARYIRETIESVLSQNYPALEFIVIDGGSEDGSVEIIKAYDESIDYWVSEPDRGQSHAINKGFEKATGDIFCWLNSDDQFAPNALWSMALSFLSHPDYDLIAGICEVYENNQLVHRHLTSCADGLLPLPELLDLDNGWNAGQFFYQPEVFFTRDIWERAGGHVREDAYYSMDYELWCRMANVGAKIKAIGVPIVHFRSHDEQKTADETAFKKELLAVKEKFLRESDVNLSHFQRPAANWQRRLKVALVNDHGYQYGAGIAHMRIAGAFDLAGQEVACFALLSSEKSDYSDIVDKVTKFSPDVVIFGNLHGVEKESITVVKQLSQHYPCFWLTHDFWLLTGRCPYMSGCEKYLHGCDALCPTKESYPVIADEQISRSWQEKWEFLESTSNLAILANSQWSAQVYRKALKARGSQVSVEEIKLGVPVERYFAKGKVETKRQLGIDPGTLTLIFSVSSLSDKRKGGQYIVEALQQLSKEYEQLAIILLGRMDTPLDVPDNVQLVAPGYTDDVSQITTALSAADVYIGPSEEETFGQVYIEAALCGTPSVGFVTSGVKEAIKHNVTGLLVEKMTATALAESVSTLLSDAELREKLSFSAPIYARAHFSLEASYQSFMQIFRGIGLVDRLGAPHKISFSAVSDLITHSTLGWSDLSTKQKMNMALRKAADRAIGSLPPGLTQRVRESLPKPAERAIMRWLSGRKY